MRRATHLPLQRRICQVATVGDERGGHNLKAALQPASGWPRQQVDHGIHLQSPVFGAEGGGSRSRRARSDAAGTG